MQKKETQKISELESSGLENKKKQKAVVDTNVLLKYIDILNEYDCILPIQVAEELDGLKKADGELGFQAREAIRKINENISNITFYNSDKFLFMPISWDKKKRDNQIIMCAKKHKCLMISNDINVLIKCNQVKVKSISYGEATNDNKYTGYKTIIMNCFDDSNQEKLNSFADNPSENVFSLYINQYCVIKDESIPIYDNEQNFVDYKIISIIKWNGSENVRLQYKDIKNDWMGLVSPRNLNQKMLFDLMQDDRIKIKMCYGGYGTGKDYVQLAHCVDMVRKGKYDKIVWLRANSGVKGIEDIGFLPGNIEEKLAPYAEMLEDILGDAEGVQLFKEQGYLEIKHIGFIRGRSFKRSILYCTESQNIPLNVMKLLLSRLGEGSILVINGDFEQVDKVQHRENTINLVCSKLKNIEEFGVVELERVERSKVADLARLL